MLASRVLFTNAYAFALSNSPVVLSINRPLLCRETDKPLRLVQKEEVVTPGRPVYTRRRTMALRSKTY